MTRAALARLRYRLQGLRGTPERQRGPLAPQDDAFRQLSFTFAVIALSARVACADGLLTREKYVAFRESFPLKGHLCGKIRSLFVLACESATPFENYVSQVKNAFPDRPELHMSLVERLCAIAAADGSISRNGERMLAAIAYKLGVSPSDYTQLLTKQGSAHAVLGVDKRAGIGKVKQRYRELMRQYHPDRFAGFGLSQEVETLLQLKSSEINEAYRLLSRKAA